MTQQPTSVDVSRSLNEPLYGTVNQTDVYFLLEYNGIYTNNAWEDAQIPSELKQKLHAYPNSHAVLIRQPGQIGKHDLKVSLFVVHIGIEKPVIYPIVRESYNDLLGLDIDAILAGQVVPAQTEPLYAVCTNGKRDICCARYGVALYDALSPLAGERVWQVSHIGGHRFAGTMFCFPHGIGYGFLVPEDARMVVETYRQGQIWLEKWRGMMDVDKPEQVAEYFLRRETHENRIDNVQYQATTKSANGWHVSFKVSGESYQVHIAEAEPLMVLSTTGDTKYKSVPQFRFISSVKTGH